MHGPSPPTGVVPTAPDADAFLGQGCRISIIVPAFCEAPNLAALIERAESINRGSPGGAELIIVDDDSRDGTVELVARLARPWVRLIVRTNERGLSSAVLAGCRAARGDILIVMDADLSHPPEKIPELVAALTPGVDMVIGSRYVPGASTGASWSVFRWINSKAATLLAAPFTAARDPMSGFFAVRRETLESGATIEPLGYKIGLEIIVKCRCEHIVEVPIRFADRTAGESKLSIAEQGRYLRHLARLARHVITRRPVESASQAAQTGFRARLRRLWSNPAAMWLAAIVPSLIAMGLTLRKAAVGRSFGNLQDFLPAAAAARNHADLYTAGAGRYVYPPLIAFLYQPLTFLSMRTAAVIMTVVAASVMILTLTVATRQIVWRIAGRADSLTVARVAAVAAWLTFDKVRAEMAMWETNIFMLLCFTLGLRWLDRRPALAGLALGFAFNIKYVPIVLMPYLLIRRRWGAAAWFGVGILLFAALPALSMGVGEALTAWKECTAGLLGLFGFKIDSPGAANVMGLKDFGSISIPSGIANMTGLTGLAPMAVAATLGLAFMVFTILLYRRRGLPFIAWPDRAAQAAMPFRALIPMEWVGIILLTLIFSPRTNARHLYMLLDINIVAAVLLLMPQPGLNRKPLLAATVLLLLALTLPPGGDAFRDAEAWWRRVAGVSWCMLTLYGVLLWTGLTYLARCGDENKPAHNAIP